MGHRQDSSHLTLKRVKDLADEIKWVGERARKVDPSVSFSYAGMCGGLESILVHLVGSTCSAAGQALIDAAFKDAYSHRQAAANAQPVQVQA